jgi:Tol biopolymer transport system component
VTARRTHRLRGLVPAAALALAVHAASATAATVPRTALVGSPGGGVLDAAVTDAELSGNATVAALTTAARNVFGPPVAADVAAPEPFPAIVSISLLDGTRRLVSEPLPEGAVDGPSGEPSVSRSGLVVAFTSLATTLTPDDTNGTADVFVRRGAEPVQLVSVAADGGVANAPSSQPDVSGDGRFVAFTSLASNLVAGDTNGQADVFLRDLLTGTTRRVSVAGDAGESDGRSSAPAVTDGGTAVAFESAADDLVSGDENGVADVFVHVMASGATERVSRSSSGTEQDRAISPPYRSVPDISADGRYVVFDTEARSLYALDTYRLTDVYLRDRRRRTTTLVSASSVNVQGDNDSVTPRITPNGRFVTFQSFAKNLVADDGPGPDLYLRDLRGGTTTLVDAPLNGTRRRPEPGGAPLQPATISDDGRTALFRSAAPGVTPGAPGGAAQLYVRRLQAPRVRVVGPVRRRGVDVRFRVAASEPRATRFLCRVDRAVPYLCGRSITVAGAAGRSISVRAGGPGLLWSPAVTVRLAGR